MKALVVPAALVLAALLWLRKRAQRSAAVPDQPAGPLASDSLSIVGSDDPDDLVTVAGGAWASLVAQARAVQGVDVATGGKAIEVEARTATQRLVIAAVQLDHADDAVVWAALGGLDGGDELAEEGRRRSLGLRRDLQDLDRQHPGDPHWTGSLAAVSDEIYAREVWARTALWPPLSRQVDPAGRAGLGREHREALAAAPTRPHVQPLGRHPHLEGALAKLDRVQDRVTQRG